MRFYTNQHPFYCGIDLHARSMYVCILSQDGEIVLHRNMKAAPEAFPKLSTTLDDMAKQIVTWFVRRWTMDVTFEEARAHLGLET